MSKPEFDPLSLKQCVERAVNNPAAKTVNWNLPQAYSDFNKNASECVISINQFNALIAKLNRIENRQLKLLKRLKKFENKLFKL